MEVLLFAHLAADVGVSRLDVELPEHATVGALLDELSRRYEIIATMRDRLAVAVDERYQPVSATLSDESTVALIPPVSGG